MNWSMSWKDTSRAAAQAVLAGRTEASGRLSVATPWSFDARDLWLSRVQPAEPAVQPPIDRPVSTHR